MKSLQINLRNTFNTIALFLVPGFIVFAFIQLFKQFDILPSSVNDFLFFIGDQSVTFQSLDKNQYTDNVIFWSNFLSILFYYIFLFIELIIISKLTQKHNLKAFKLDLKGVGIETMKDNPNSYTSLIYNTPNFNLNTISDFTKLAEGYNKSKSPLPLVFFMVGSITPFIFFGTITTKSSEIISSTIQNDVHRFVLLIVVYILSCVFSIGFSIVLISFISKKFDKANTLKMYFLERVRQFFKAHKLIYLDDQKVKELSETDFVARFFKAFGSLTVSINEGVVIQIKDSFRPILVLDAYYNSGGKKPTIRHFMVLVSDNPDDHFGHTVSYSTNSRVWDFKLGNRVKTESVVFDKKFDSFSEDQIEARLALKTNLMQDMIDLENHCPGKTMFYFYDNKFIVCVEQEDSLFEIKGKVDIQNLDLAASSIYNDLNLALNIYRNFWLSRKSWKSI